MKKLQVFVSSAYLDLRNERQAAVDAILRAGHIPAGMELFAAGDKSQADVIRRWIDESDVFMLILGGRYGSVDPDSKLGYTHLEYRYAVETKKPYFAAVMSPAALERKVREEGTSAVDLTHGKDLQDFRAEVTGRISRFFNDLNELKVVVFESLNNRAADPAMVGWVRGDQVVDPVAVLNEAERVRRENEALKARVGELESSVAALGGNSGLPALGDRAMQILTHAAGSDSQIMFSKHLAGTNLQAGTFAVEIPGRGREYASWKGAIDELASHGLIEDLGHQGAMFAVSALGYQLFDGLKAEGPRADAPTT